MTGLCIHLFEDIDLIAPQTRSKYSLHVAIKSVFNNLAEIHVLKYSYKVVNISVNLVVESCRNISMYVNSRTYV